jgi:hypothetical protein
MIAIRMHRRALSARGNSPLLSLYRLPLGAGLKQTFIVVFRERNVADFDLKRRQTDLLSRLSESQGSSVVEQGTHKPLVGSSNLPPGMGNAGNERDRRDRKLAIDVHSR